MTLEGTIVRLEPLLPDHAPELSAAANADRSTFRFTDVPADEATMTRYIEVALAAPDQYPFAIRRLGDGALVGSTRFGSLQWWHGADRPSVAEIGWTWLAVGAQRTAVNTEAKLLLLTHAFDVWGVERLQLKTDRLNDAEPRRHRAFGRQVRGVPAPPHASDRSDRVPRFSDVLDHPGRVAGGEIGSRRPPLSPPLVSRHAPTRENTSDQDSPQR